MRTIQIVLLSQLAILFGCSVDTDGYTFVSMDDTDAETTSDGASVTSSDSTTTADTTTMDGIDTSLDSGTGAQFYSDTIMDSETNFTSSDEDSASENDTDSHAGADSNMTFDGTADTDTTVTPNTNTANTGNRDTHTSDTASAETNSNDTQTEPECNPTNGGVEICDGIDNNCNGDIDESGNTLNDPQHCGACKNNCMTDPSLWRDFGNQLPEHMSAASCINGHCGVANCDPGYSDDPAFPYPDCDFHIKHLMVGDNHSCLLTFDNTVYCWGLNGAGQLGRDTGDDYRYIPAAPVDALHPGTGVSIIELGAGYEFTCALLSDNTVQCWGNNLYGQLGRTTTGTSTHIPGAVELNLDANTTITDLAVGSSHACVALSDNTIQCWGKNSSGELGRDIDGDSGTPVPGEVENFDAGTGNSVTTLVAGSGHTCALMSNSTIQCWGSNYAGQLGRSIGAVTSELPPAPVSGLSLSPGVSISAIAAGQSHTCATLSDDSIQCWGANHRGQLGRDTSPDETDGSPEEVASLSLDSASVLEVTTAVEHTCALLSDSTVQCWGMNLNDQLGRKTTDISTRIPAAMTGLVTEPGVTIMSISSGGGHNCIVLSDNTVQCWGNNYYGQLGYVTEAHGSSPNPAPVNPLF